MDLRILDCLQGKQGDYILPFLWLHGESKERVYEEILAIKNSGINEFCAESRPYEEFCSDSWWDDFGFILKTAKELNMRVWLLDDKKFPTGYANGYLEAPERAHLRKKLIRELQVEVLGPMKNAKIFVTGRMNENEKVISVIAYRHSEFTEELDYSSAIDITDTVQDGMAYFDIPNGVWRVCVTIETAPYEYENDKLFYYIDMLNYDSCHAMIDAIYQPHYEHFSEYFGNTFAGFFSDEPGFLNVCYTYFNTLGKMHSPYPWSDELPQLIAESAGISKSQVMTLLPALWENLGDATALIRAHYMDVITKLYSKNFSYMLGNWCREHGVMYIGHVIEDMGAHMRTGYGSGHYFRALDGQDMAGIDIVLMQDMPGISNQIHRGPLADDGLTDPRFFRYTLPKLAASHSHIQPLKKGRAMCEIFGAFGWAEGLPFMKGLADIMLSSGINYFVPHAFSPNDEDTDCPPHFYNGGRNIQYPLFKNLISYMSRCSHMISGGIHVSDVAVFYNAEGEWSGGKNQLFFEICASLTKSLIDFDIVPFDILADATVKDGRLYINGESYGALIISESEILPYDRLKLFSKLSQLGLPVIFTNALPSASCERKDISEILPCFEAVSTSELPSKLKSMGLYHVSGNGLGAEAIRFYHISRDSKDIYLISNEDINSNFDGQILVKNQGECLIYEPWDNKCYRYDAKDGVLDLHLEKGNMLFVVFGEKAPDDAPYYSFEVERKELPLRFDISIKEEGSEDFVTIAENSPCFDISSPDRYPHFSGSICYETTFTGDFDFTVLDLGQVGEVAEVYLNGKHVGTRINAPYKFSLRDALSQGENKLKIIVTSNLAHRRRDDLSFYMQIPPSGIIGDISLCKYSK